MITIKATLKRVIPLKQYENIQPEVEIIEQIDLDMNDTEIKVRQQQLLDLCHETLTEYKTEIFKPIEPEVPQNWTDKSEKQKLDYVKAYPQARELLNSVGIVTPKQLSEWCNDLKWQWTKIESELIAIGIQEADKNKPEGDKMEDIEL